MFGFINIDKPKGMTSFDVVRVLRKITQIKQIGHTGTLDPFATGVLPICIGKAARLIEYLPDDKEYIAKIQFGKTTDTYDVDGQVIQTFTKKVCKEEIVAALKNFEGEIEQIPPIYSAIKVKGKKLYEYARQNIEVEIKPRKVTVNKIELLEFNPQMQTAKVIIQCSKGTYIRSIANDLGKILDTGAYLEELQRTKAGLFTIEKSIKLENVNKFEDIKSNIINPSDVMNLPCYNMDETEKNRVIHGMDIANKNNFLSLHIVILQYNDKIYAVGQVEKDKIIIRKVFELL